MLKNSEMENLKNQEIYKQRNKKNEKNEKPRLLRNRIKKA